ncbi:TPA: phosphatase PAP2 family protein [Stenotrophomonas maltophilia]|jgi:membrane-associated phospholipid phosphatase|nr:phosphatase PAP2 family protein [Stenotrophomonas maltophilia]
MMTFWESLSALGDSRALFPLATVLALFLPTSHRHLLWRWAVAITVVAATTLASKIAFMGWGFGLEHLDFTGISGHAAMSSVLYPVALWLLASGRSRHLRAWAGVGAGLAVAIGCSRLPLRAHSPSEIIIGLSLGLAASAWVLRHGQILGNILAVHGRPALLAIAAAMATPILLADLHTHDLVKAAAKILSGRAQAFERQDLRGHSSPDRSHHYTRSLHKS